MPKPIIEVDGMSKLYRLGLIGATTFYESVERWWCRLRGKEEMCRKIGSQRTMISPDDPQSGPEPNTLWALKDISFSVDRGDIVGIIGRNGAGKSTLLKILSRITEPTSGKATIYGRTSSLLEVGTGFHPELTGRENTYLNGAILGMRKSEIDRKFDEIVAFAELEKFIDTPVKRYSSGMYVRLAFAIAAHLEPEILLVDEVLAVGDVGFQKKCLDKMDTVAKEGRTVLFVSHNMIALRRLCKKAVLLKDGKVFFLGDIVPCIEKYLEVTGPENKDGYQYDFERSKQGGTGEVRFLSLRITHPDGTLAKRLCIDEDFDIHIVFETTQHVQDLIVGLGIVTMDDFVIFATHWNDFGKTYTLEKGTWTTSVRVSPNYLRHGKYTIGLGAISGKHTYNHLNPACRFSIEPLVLKEQYYDERIGALFIPMKWTDPKRMEENDAV